MLYRRVMLKLSGEALGSGGDGRGVDLASIGEIAEQMARAASQGVQIAVVTGAGNLWRGGRNEGLSLERTVSDTVGMLGTVINSLVLGQLLEQVGARAEVFSSIGPSPLVRGYEIALARRALDEGRVVIVAGGTSNPFFTTDSAAALRGLELQVDVLLKATTVDGVYSADPKKDPNAVRYEHLTFQEAVERRLEIMDTAAFSLCRDGNVPIFVFNLARPRGILEALLGEGPGTRIDKEESPSCS